jgi:hypothetical protein
MLLGVRLDRLTPNSLSQAMAFLVPPSLVLVLFPIACGRVMAGEERKSMNMEDEVPRVPYAPEATWGSDLKVGGTRSALGEVLDDHLKCEGPRGDG